MHFGSFSVQIVAEMMVRKLYNTVRRNDAAKSEGNVAKVAVKVFQKDTMAFLCKADS